MNIEEVKKLVYNRIPKSIKTENVNECILEYLNLTGYKDSPLLESLTEEAIKLLLNEISENKDIITIYHGSVDVIEKPEYKKGKKDCDYGSGFYCTEDEEAGRLWSVNNNVNGFNSKYKIDLTNLKVLRLEDSAVIQWLSLLLKNRIPKKLNDDIEKIRKEFVDKNCSVNVEDYDVVIGYRADDSYFSIAKGFLTGIIKYDILEESLKLGELGIQVVLVSEKAFNAIRFVESESVLAEVYYSKYLRKDTRARKVFKELRERSIRSNSGSTVGDFL